MGIDNPPSCTVLTQFFKTPDTVVGVAVVLYRGYTSMVVYWVVTVVSRESWITSQRQWKGWLSRTHDH